jgi:butyrate kinase
MTTFFKSSIAAAAAVFALSGVGLSGVAQAESITISLAGKDARTVHAEIAKAAYQVCREVGPDSIAITGQADCVSDTIAKADADLRGLSLAPIHKAELADLRSPR